MGDAVSAGGFGLQVQPMVHVAEIASAIGFYERLGGSLVYGSRDGDWALMRFGSSHVSLLAHPPGPEAGPVELHFVSAEPLERLEAHLRLRAPDRIVRGVADEAFGRMLTLRMPDGQLLKVLELDRGLIA
ncbi:VOC family protein [Methylobacterium nonmethylotrophicum]|uniref:VOC family protein n=1 Tax=Methylobacterium nonmethylotrophicum TaxID=1141884 RepID=A0A4Z0NTC0_9HYPH|nr:VOC family protein [Methylobacterium nonmethylotrophicum]TGD99867.1 VOC family protein [Methylobacterium nonmethylotrophicum]